MAEAKRDANYVPTLLAVSNVDGSTPVTLYADPITHRLLTSTTVGSLSSISDVTITSGTQGMILYYNGTAWVNLNPGTSGQFLKTQGAGANPIWDTATATIVGTDTYVLFFDGANNPVGSAGLTYAKATGLVTLAGSIQLPNSGLRLFDTNASHSLIITPGSNITQDRVFTITTGDAARTLSMSGNITTGGDFVMVGTNSVTFTNNGTTSLTLPLTGTLATLAGTETLTNKTLDTPSIGTATITTSTIGSSNSIVIKDASFTLVDDSDTTKKAQFQASGITAGQTRTVTLPDSNTTVPIISQIVTVSGFTAARTLTFPDQNDTVMTLGTAQTVTGTKTFGADVLIATSPKIVTNIHDTNGNIILNIGATGSAVNYVKITNAATGTAGPIIAADGETNVDLKVAGKGTGKVHSTTGSFGDITSYTPNVGSTATLTLQTSNVHAVTFPAGNITLATSNPSAGQIFVVTLTQDGTGSRTVTWFSDIKWATGTAPTLTTGSNKGDTFVFLATTVGSFNGYIVGQNI